MWKYVLIGQLESFLDKIGLEAELLVMALKKWVQFHFSNSIQVLLCKSLINLENGVSSGTLTMLNHIAFTLLSAALMTIVAWCTPGGSQVDMLGSACVLLSRCILAQSNSVRIHPHTSELVQATVSLSKSPTVNCERFAEVIGMEVDL